VITKRYLIPANGPQSEPIKEALSLLVQLLRSEFSSVRRVTLLVPKLLHLESSTLGEAIGRNLARLLEQGKPISINAKVQLEPKTIRTLSRHGYPELVLALWVNRKMLDAIDSLLGLRAVIVVPWLEDEVENWRRTWNPVVRGKEVVPEETLISNAVVEEALDELAGSINLGTGLSHPSDKESAESMLWHLHNSGEWEEPANMRAWALRKGWPLASAEDLQAAAEKIQKRRSPPKGAQRRWGPQAVARFREKVKQRGNT
jgi:hypothetical protein